MCKDHAPGPSEEPCAKTRASVKDCLAIEHNVLDWLQVFWFAQRALRLRAVTAIEQLSQTHGPRAEKPQARSHDVPLTRGAGRQQCIRVPRARFDEAQ